jgi:hypothetical protein
MDYSPEVLIYLQTVKSYFKTNEEAREYFISNVDEELFYQHLCEISEKNFKKNGEVMLTKEQFELLRKTLTAIEISTKEMTEDTPNPEENIFIDMRGYGKICLN